MAKYGKMAGEKVEKAMREMKEGKLKTGSGKKVTSRDQAIAIGLSEARKDGGKVPEKEDTKPKQRPNEKQDSKMKKHPREQDLGKRKGD